MIWEIIATFFCAIFGTCEDENCRTINYGGGDYIVCSFAVDNIHVRLFLNDDKGKPHGHLRSVANSLSKPTILLMNGGMYHEDLGAVGLYIEKGVKTKNISTKGGWGNFHLLPNGVFWGKNGQLSVRETKAFIQAKIKPDFATQSGPMLVIDGKLHPRFLRNSDSQKIRNGVGVSKDGKTIHFAISKSKVTFWNFGKLFQEELQSHNALFLDGTVSALRTKSFSVIGWRSLGPIIGVFEKDK